MIPPSRVLRVFACTTPVDLRAGFDTLRGHVRSYLGEDPLSGDCFLFVNRSRSSAKVLFWDGTGLCILFKRLERGRFSALCSASSSSSLQMTAAELALFLQGANLAGKLPLSPKELVF